MKTYETVIGLEIHVELNTQSKMFCACPADYFGASPNTHTCPVCLGLPGALPYPNKKAIESCIAIGLSLGCKINSFSFFERKNYFYPDLAKGFQTSQYLHPFGHDGFIEIPLKGGIKRIGITRVHMEEDTGKNIHTTVNGEKVSLIDFNRSGVPLVEIVTEPDIRSSEEAKLFLTELQKIIRYLNVSDADMEKGHMRLEPNISVREVGQIDLPNYKVEVKNINSFRFVEKAIQYETKRHIELLEKEEKIAQETRGWNETKNKTISQRSKEEAHDYRYFPEPDIPPILFDQKTIQEIKNNVPELPLIRAKRFYEEYKISEVDAEILTRDKDMADFYEKTVEDGKGKNLAPKDIAKTIINKKIDVSKVLPSELILAIIQSKHVATIDEDELRKIIQEVIAENESAVNDYKNGKENALMFLLGQTMKKIGRKVDVNQVKQILTGMVQ